MSVRAEILTAARSLQERGVYPFSPADILQELRRAGTAYPESTIRTHVVSVMCVDAPANHAIRYPDLSRVSRGQYELAPTAGEAPEHASRRTPANERSQRRSRGLQREILTALEEHGGASRWPLPELGGSPELDWQLDDLVRRAYVQRVSEDEEESVRLTAAGRSAARTGLAETDLARRQPLEPFELELLHQLMWDAADAVPGELRRRYLGGIKWLLEEHFGVETKDKAGPHGKVRNDAMQRLEAIGAVERIGGGQASRTPNCWVTDPSMAQYPW